MTAILTYALLRGIADALWRGTDPLAGRATWIYMRSCGWFLVWGSFDDVVGAVSAAMPLPIFSPMRPVFGSGLLINPRQIVLLESR